MKILAAEKLRGQKRNLPTVGVIEIPVDGILDLEESLAAALVDSNIGYSYVTKKKKEDESKTKQVAGTKDQNTDFEKLSLQDLIELANEAEFPKEEWEKFSKNTKKAKELMIIYLTKKLK